MSDTTSPPSQPPQDFPPVDPTTFDLIIIGTGLPQSIIAAAASTAGKSVLHLDPNPFYGSHFSSLSPPDFPSFLSPPPHNQHPPLSLSSVEYDVVSLSSKPLNSLLDTLPFPNQINESTLRFSLDVSGPRVLFCADAAVDLLVKSGVSHYIEFKSVDTTLIYDGEVGAFSSVPDSRRAVFMDKNLKLTEKTELNKFFNLVQQHLSSSRNGNGGGVISEEDLESPFVEFLNRKILSRKFQRTILYAIAFADYDQENLDICKDLLKTKDGIARLALHHSSTGRFPNAPGAMLYPMYGQGELPQAFCRRAAVKGCIHVLRMPVAALLADKGSGHYRGVKLASGQDIFSQQLLVDPHFEVPQAMSLPSFGGSSGNFQDSILRENKKVARGICITRKSLKPEATNLLIVFPPRSLYPEQVISVRALQLGSNTAVCPSGMFIMYLSALCGDASQGENLLTAAINALFEQPMSGSSDNPEDESVALSEATKEQKPAVLWTALYIQKIKERSIGSISSSPSPDGYLGYNNLIDITEKMFQQMFPGEDFFPVIASAEVAEDAEDFGPD